MILFSLIVLFGAFHMFKSNYGKTHEGGRQKWREYLSGVKNTNSARLYPFLALLRRSLMITWLVLSKTFGIENSILGLLLVQVPYLAYIMIVRPMDRKKNNMVEIINELFLTVIISFLSYFNTESKWNSQLTKLFMYIVLGNTVIITLLVTSKFKY